MLATEPVKRLIFHKATRPDVMNVVPTPSPTNSESHSKRPPVPPPELVRANSFTHAPLILYPPERLAPFLGNSEIRTVGAGLNNLGNTCFLNSVLQCLMHTTPFVAFLRSHEHSRSCNALGFCLLCALEKLADETFDPARGKKPLSPKAIVSNLKNISARLHWGRQEDAHEFLHAIFETVQKRLLPKTKQKLSPRIEATTLLHQLFGGHLQSQVRCPSCGHESNTFDPFWDLSLDVQSSKSITGALQHFTAPEILDTDNKYKCENCKKAICARKQLTIRECPNLLLLHLKRFSSGLFGGAKQHGGRPGGAAVNLARLFGSKPGRQGSPSKKQQRHGRGGGGLEMMMMMGMGMGTGRAGKITRHIAFPEELDLSPFLTRPAPARYDLYGVLIHSGSTVHSGHYYSYVKSGAGVWHCMDDDMVRPVSVQEVLESGAYMLFYRLTTPKPNPFEGGPLPAPGTCATLIPIPTKPTASPAPAPAPAPAAIPQVSEVSVTGAALAELDQQKSNPEKPTKKQKSMMLLAGTPPPALPDLPLTCVPMEPTLPLDPTTTPQPVRKRARPEPAADADVVDPASPPQPPLAARLFGGPQPPTPMAPAIRPVSPMSGRVPGVTVIGEEDVMATPGHPGTPSILRTPGTFHTATPASTGSALKRVRFEVPVGLGSGEGPVKPTTKDDDEDEDDKEEEEDDEEEEDGDAEAVALQGSTKSQCATHPSRQSARLWSNMFGTDTEGNADDDDDNDEDEDDDDKDPDFPGDDDEEDDGFGGCVVSNNVCFGFCGTPWHIHPPHHPVGLHVLDEPMAVPRVHSRPARAKPGTPTSPAIRKRAHTADPNDPAELSECMLVEETQESALDFVPAHKPAPSPRPTATLPRPPVDLPTQTTVVGTPPAPRVAPRAAKKKYAAAETPAPPPRPAKVSRPPHQDGGSAAAAAAFLQSAEGSLKVDSLAVPAADCGSDDEEPEEKAQPATTPTTTSPAPQPSASAPASTSAQPKKATAATEPPRHPAVVDARRRTPVASALGKKRPAPAPVTGGDDDDESMFALNDVELSDDGEDGGEDDDADAQEEGEVGHPGLRRRSDEEAAAAVGQPVRGLGVDEIPCWEGLNATEIKKAQRMLTRPLQMPTVKRDEWDQALDKGHTKKVRTKRTIDATQPNPFQLLAEQKRELKAQQTESALREASRDFGGRGGRGGRGGVDGVVAGEAGVVGAAGAGAVTERGRRPRLRSCGDHPA
ncbi:putative Ubiquitin carboxyl-terminal hydrolase 23 [Paratrimastix pyriformis]|uniref:ubiquitinyl hydrolase 1 n=1 Tax=Paratrimastix pyriformis TaxID=342808 RepID=A0ABQ8UD28_9EUKA|nr:putative Ubiquitin carboxyl-terminal hydrolase 23 [Paratrimastix pyriformis]